MIHRETSKVILGDASDGTHCSPHRAAGQAGEPQEGNGTHSQVLSPGLVMCTPLLRGTAALCVLHFLHCGPTMASLTPKGVTLGREEPGPGAVRRRGGQWFCFPLSPGVSAWH